MKNITLEKGSHIANIRFNRPDVLNALSLDMAIELRDLMVNLEDDSSVRCIIMGGEGRAFMAGGDLGYFYKNIENIEETLDQVIGTYHQIIISITNMRKPVINMVHGAIAGGGIGLALSGDYVVAAENSVFNMAYTAIGTSPDGGSTYLLPRLVGRRIAMEMALLNKEVNAEEALRLGLVNVVVKEEDRVATANKVAEKLVLGPPHAIGEAKSLINQSLESDSLDSHLNLEKKKFIGCAGMADFREGLEAFLEKRKPNFTGSEKK